MDECAPPGRRGAIRLYALTGLLLVIVAMLFGEIYAIWISHVANGEIRQHWDAVANAAAAGRAGELPGQFSFIFELADVRGRFMGTHSHLGSLGLVALMLALIQPFLGAGDAPKWRMSILFVVGATLQVAGNFLGQYVAASLYVSDIGGIMVAVVVVGVLWILTRGPRGPDVADWSRRCLALDAGRILLRSGVLLIAIGLIGGLLYAWQLVYQDEPRMQDAMHATVAATALGNESAEDHVREFKRLQSKIAITAAAHSHAIEFGFLMLLLAPLQAWVFLSGRWRLRWAIIMSVGAFLLPVCVYLATRYGLRAAAGADLSGGLVIVSLCAMGVGMLRHSGRVDTKEGSGS